MILIKILLAACVFAQLEATSHRRFLSKETYVKNPKSEYIELCSKFEYFTQSVTFLLLLFKYTYKIQLEFCPTYKKKTRYLSFSTIQVFLHVFKFIKKVVDGVPSRMCYK